MSTKPRKSWPPIGKLRLFTLEQGEYIKRMCRKYSDAELAERMNKKFKTTFKASQVASFINNRGFQTGRDTTFKKGNRPWNDGTKGYRLTRANKTSFKKGNYPTSAKPVGSERLDRDGYIYVKTSKINPKTGRLWWRLKHVILWESHHGPVPPGHNVQFIDGDRTRIEIENLELISKAVNALRNKMRYSSFEPEIKPLITAIAKIDHATYKRRKDKNGKQADKPEQHSVRPARKA